MHSERFLLSVGYDLYQSARSICAGVLSKLDKKLILLLCLPLLLLLLNDSWIFSYVLTAWIDRWIYLGYFLDLKEHLNTFTGAYYGTRLPWIFPGFLAYRFLPPLIAAYAIHLLFYYAAVVSLYLILKRTIGQNTALLTAVLMGCHYHFLEAIGGDYVDGAGLTYLLLTLLMLTNSSECQRFSLRLCLAGVFYACSVCVQLFLINYAPLIVLYFIFITRKRNPFPLIPSFGCLMIGFLGAIVLFSTLHYLLTGTFFFLLPTVRFASEFVSIVNAWIIPISAWWMKATWLVFPTIVFLGSLLVLMFYRVMSLLSFRRVLLFSQVYFILNILIHVVWELKFRQPVLQLHYYSSYMIPAMFVSLGALLAIVVEQMRSKGFYLLLGSILIVESFSYIYPSSFQWVASFNFHWLVFPILIGIAGVAGVIIRYPYCKEVTVFLFLIFLTLTNGYWNLQYNRDFSLQKHSFLAVVDSVRAVQSMDPKGNSFFWYDRHHPLFTVFLSVSSCYLWGCRVINEEFPSVHAKIWRQPALHDRIFLLTQDRSALEKANESLAQIGLKGELINEKTIERGDVYYHMLYIEMRELGSKLTTALPIKLA